jgi:glycosyltransferase involved in cell wall biosynthesis
VTGELRPGITAAVACHPARMAGHLLVRALTSIAAQTLQPAAIVVVNDVDRQGAGWTRRTLLDSVTTEWIAWCDSDDTWYPDHLAKLHAHALATGAVFVYSWFDGNDPLGHFGLTFDPCRPHHTTMTHLVRTDIAKMVSFPDSSSGPFSNEDWAFITGVAAYACANGLVMSHLPERTWHYQQHGQNSSGKPGQGDA